MPLPIAHGFVGAGIVAAVHPKFTRIISFPLLFGGFLANAADLDFFLTVTTGDKSWHRGFTHSLLFAALVFLSFVIILGRDRIREATAYVAYSSHLVLDYATSDGGGPQLLWFFSDERFSVGLRSFSLALQDFQPLILLLRDCGNQLYLEFYFCLSTQFDEELPDGISC